MKYLEDMTEEELSDMIDDFKQAINVLKDFRYEYAPDFLEEKLDDIKEEYNNRKGLNDET